MMTGIDISNYQKGLDLSLLPVGGYKFVILKLSEGRTFSDACFDKFYSVASASGIPVGAYVYSHATTPQVAQAEASYALGLLKGRKLQLGIYMDIETSTQMQIPKDQLKETAKAFAKTVKQAGYGYGIYGSEYNTWSRLYPDDFDDGIVWVAHYGKVPGIYCDLWQKSDSGQFPGWGSGVDVDESMSDKFVKLVEKKEEEKPKQGTIYPIDPSISILQMVMQYNEFWDGKVDGRYSDEFIKAYFEFGEGIRKTWTGK